MEKSLVQNIFKYTIVLVWLANGLFCKVLNYVPRHELIVSSILGSEFSRPLTCIIGISEIAMAIWFISGVKRRLNGIIQIAIVAIMNILEYFLVPDLLLWGKLNSIFAFFFISIVYYYQFHLYDKSE